MCGSQKNEREQDRAKRERKKRKFRKRGANKGGGKNGKRERVGERPRPKYPWFSWEFHSPDASGDQKVTTLPDNTLVIIPRA